MPSAATAGCAAGFEQQLSGHAAFDQQLSAGASRRLNRARHASDPRGRSWSVSVRIGVMYPAVIALDRSRCGTDLAWPRRSGAPRAHADLVAEPTVGAPGSRRHRQAFARFGVCAPTRGFARSSHFAAVTHAVSTAPFLLVAGWSIRECSRALETSLTTAPVLRPQLVEAAPPPRAESTESTALSTRPAMPRKALMPDRAAPPRAAVREACVGRAGTRPLRSCCNMQIAEAGHPSFRLTDSLVRGRCCSLSDSVECRAVPVGLGSYVLREAVASRA